MNANGEQPPSIRMGLQLPYVKNPILGKKRGNIVIAVINAILKARIVRGGNEDKLLIAQNGGLLFQLMETSSTTAGGGYRGTYDPSATYSAGDIVRTVSGGTTVVGVWGCIATGSITGITPVEGTSWHSLVANSGFAYAGDWDSTQTYQSGTIVRVRTGGAPGFWVVAPGQTATPGVAPVWPEGSTWHLIAAGPTLLNICQGGTGTMIFNALSPT